MNRKRRRIAAAQHRQSSSTRPRLEKSSAADRVDTLMSLAVGHHQSGRLGPAEQCYREILAIEPSHVDGLHLLGILAHKTGRNELAADLIGKAIALNDQVPIFHSNIALALRSLGRKDDAIAHLRRAIALKPDFFDALWALGHILHQRGELDEAAARYRSVLALRPDHAEAHNNLGAVLADQGRLDEAVAQYRQALATKPDYSEAHYNLGNALLGQGRLEETVAHYQRALALQPRMAELHNNLAIVLLRQGKLDEAVTHYRQALAIRPDYAKAYNNLGNVLRVWQGKSDEAVAAYRQAISIKPDYADAFNNLGNALRELGSLAEARAACEKAIELVPKNPMFHHSLAILKRFAQDDQQLAAMETIASEAGSLSAQDRIYLHFALAKAYDDLGDYDRSFRHLREGNALKRQEIIYDEADVRDHFARIMDVFTSALMNEKRELGDSSSVPIFIIGMPRSGTSLIEQILASHPKVFGAGELRTLANAVARLCQPAPFPDAISSMGQKELQELGASYVAEIRQVAPNAERITDKMPANFRFAGLIHLVLPQARIIHVRRDPVDTCYSCFSKLFVGELPYSYDLAELGHYYRAYEGLMAHWRKVLPPGVMLEIQYEQVTADLEGEARRIVAHCGLEWDDACLSFHESERPVRTASAVQVRQPIYRNSIGRWRPYQHLLGPLIDVLTANQSLEALR
jgi:tetratricopeptide (TPR) repeat protein